MVDKVAICGCKNSDCGVVAATAVEFLGAMEHRNMCAPQIYAVALAMMTVAESMVDATVDAFAQVDFHKEVEDKSMANILQGFLQSRSNAQEAKGRVKDTMNDYLNKDNKARAKLYEFVDAARDSVPGFKEMQQELSAQRESDGVLDYILSGGRVAVVSLDDLIGGKKTH